MIDKDCDDPFIRCYWVFSSQSRTLYGWFNLFHSETCSACTSSSFPACKTFRAVKLIKIHIPYPWSTYLIVVQSGVCTQLGIIPQFSVELSFLFAAPSGVHTFNYQLKLLLPRFNPFHMSQQLKILTARPRVLFRTDSSPCWNKTSENFIHKPSHQWMVRGCTSEVGSDECADSFLCWQRVGALLGAARVAKRALERCFVYDVSHDTQSSRLRVSGEKKRIPSSNDT